MNITAPIRRLARITPDAVAIIGADGRALTYATLEHAIDRMTVYAARAGVQPDDLVGLPIAPPDEVTGLVLALALARMGVGTGEPSLPRDAMRLCFEPGSSPRPGRVGFDASWMLGDEVAATPIRDNPDAVCRVFASSGTTGMPKHVPVSHALMARRVYGRWLGLSGGRAVHMVAVGLGGAWGFATVLRTLWQGGTLVVPDARDLAGAIARHGVTVLSASPAVLRSLLDQLPANHPPFPSLDALEIGGSMFPMPLLEQATTRVCRTIVSHLGSSEVGGIASAPMAVLAARSGGVGYPWPDVEVQALDDAGEPLPPGQEGVLRLRGPAVAAGYLANEAETALRFRDGWFHSSDLGATWPDGMLTLSGRASDLINTGGSKVSPHLVEEGLLKLPLVIEAAAFGVPDASGIERVWAAIVAREPIAEAVLEAYCARAPRGRAPVVILQLEALPRNASGKVQRERLVALALGMGGAG